MRIINFKKNFEELRKAHNLTQEQIAEKIGVSRQVVTNWKSGRNLPDIQTLAIICDMFGTTSDELLFETNESELLEEDILNKLAKDIEYIKERLNTNSSYDVYKSFKCNNINEEIQGIDFCCHGDMERDKGDYTKALKLYEMAAMYGDINGVISAIDLRREILELCEDDMSVYYSELSHYAKKLVEYGRILTDVLEQGDLI